MPEFPIDAIREQFPALALTDEGRARVYLDNPAGTQIPRRVIEAVTRAFIEGSSNLGGDFASSEESTRIVREAREAMVDFLGAGSPDEIIVGPSMTALTFRLSLSLGQRFRPGDEIIVTRMDHEGNISPWLHMAEDHGLEVKWLPFDEDSWQIEPEALQARLSGKTRLLALNYASNLTGSINHMRGLIAMAKEAGALVWVDAVQLAPHRLVDVAELGCDFLVCSSYKFFGPHLGILWGRKALLEELRAYRVRCAPSSAPSKFEWGTPQIELSSGLRAAVDYFAWLGETNGGEGERRGKISRAFEACAAYETRLTAELIAGLIDIPGVTIHGITNPNRAAERVPTVSFTHARHRPPQVAAALAKQGICVWSGHNYALEIARQLRLHEEDGVVRIGLAHYNTSEEVARTVAALARTFT